MRVDDTKNSAIRFQNDYMDGAHPLVLQALIETNSKKTIGYGEDQYCKKAKKSILTCINEKLSKPVDSHNVSIEFFSSGTITNLTLICAALRPHEGVLCSKDAHINVHEAGAIEARGHKVLVTRDPRGVLSIDSLNEIYNGHFSGGFGGAWHMVKPGMVYYSNATEDGFVYSRELMRDIYHWAQERNLKVYIDGARLGSALAAKSNNASLGDIFNYSDAFSIGGTKNGALFGEALVIKDRFLQKDFKYIMKQCGAVLPKGRLLGVQFDTLFDSDTFSNSLFYFIASYQNKLANILREELKKIGLSIIDNGGTNQVFLDIPNSDVDFFSKELGAGVCYKRGNKTTIRFATSWSTRESEIYQLKESLISYRLKQK